MCSCYVITYTCTRSIFDHDWLGRLKFECACWLEVPFRNPSTLLIDCCPRYSIRCTGICSNQEKEFLLAWSFGSTLLVVVVVLVVHSMPTGIVYVWLIFLEWMIVIVQLSLLLAYNSMCTATCSNQEEEFLLAWAFLSTLVVATAPRVPTTSSISVSWSNSSSSSATMQKVHPQHTIHPADYDISHHHILHPPPIWYQE